MFPCKGSIVDPLLVDATVTVLVEYTNEGNDLCCLAQCWYW